MNQRISLLVESYERVMSSASRRQFPLGNQIWNNLPFCYNIQFVNILYDQ